MLSSQFCEIPKSTFFTEQLWTTDCDICNGVPFFVLRYTKEELPLISVFSVFYEIFQNSYSTQNTCEQLFLVFSVNRRCVN